MFGRHGLADVGRTGPLPHVPHAGTAAAQAQSGPGVDLPARARHAAHAHRKVSVRY